MFTIFTEKGKSKSGMEISSGLGSTEYKRTYLVSNMVAEDTSIYNYIDRSPSSIARALAKFRAKILPVIDNADITKNTRSNPTEIADSDKAKNQKGNTDVLMNMVGELMDIDKFNLFIGTLASLVKSIKFYNPRDNTFIAYTDGKSLGPLSMADV